ncbi:helix-turn-helix domain-containing protein [Lapidilactobacillus mulanensis]|uniref:Helix-turn-helix domain-containing protein n=1 Tax=Lapidilactobacillus mulanensis TaxID=2485999 RepID=A0ABW4DLR8_9LACO|nr:helix-turn-helix transcriptional regulator [Lapidilactobacillus mulanensis]
MSLGSQLQHARQEMSLTQEQVATQLNVARQTISSWENERSYPDIQSLIDLSDFYHLSLDQLIKGDQSMVADMKEKEKEARNYRYIFVVSELINIALLLLFLLSHRGIKAFQMGHGTGLIVVILMFLNVATIFFVQRRYNEVKKTPAKSMSRRTAFIFKLITACIIVGLLAWGFTINNYFITGIAGSIFAGSIVLQIVNMRHK